MIKTGPRRRLSSALSFGMFAAAAAILISATTALATEVAVSFRDVGYGSFAGSQLQNIGSPKSLLSVPGITGVEFVQDTPSGRFEILTAGCDSQGNDVAVTLRLTVDPSKVAGSVNGKIEIPVCVNWLDQPNGKIEGFGFMLPEGSEAYINITVDPSKDLYFSRSAPTVGTNFFADLTKSGGNKTYVFDGTSGSSFIGSANFKPADLVAELNTYYAAVNSTVPELTVTKTAVDSDASIPNAKAGDSVAWTVTATNTGTSDLRYSAFADGFATTKTYLGLDTNSDGTVDNTSPLTTSSVLLAGQTWKWSVSHVLTQAEVNAVKVENVASVTATDSSTSTTVVAYSAANGTASKSATAPAALGGAIVQLPASPAIDGVKTVAITNDLSPTGLSAGDTLTYTVAATNTGNVTLSGVSVQSDTLKRADLGSPINTLGSFSVSSGSTTLLPGATVSFTATYLVAQADIDAGGLTNTATVAGIPPTGAAVTDVTDDGDDGDGNATNDQTLLTVAASPAMTVTKVADARALSAAPKVGEVIGYTITVTNSGNVTLSDIVLEDALTSDEVYVSGDTNSNSKLDLSETWSYSASHTLTQADIDAGKVENLAIASATPPSGSGARFSVESSSASSGNATAGISNGTATTTTLAASAAMTVKKVADESALSATPKVGELIGYTITVTNSGNVTLSDIVLEDALTSDEAYESGDINSNSKLDLSETWIYSASHTLTQSDIDAGKVENLAVASATPPSGSGARFSVESSSASSGNATARTGNGTATTTTLNADAAMTVKKVADESALSAAPKAGEVIGYAITVKNSGNVTLSDIVLEDALTSDEVYVSGDTNSNSKLDLSETWIYSASHTLTQADIDAAKVENLAIASATPPSGNGARFSVESSSASSGNATAGTGNGTATTTTLAASAAMTVKKVADESALSAAPKAGGLIGYTITVTNSGNVTLSDIVLEDALTSDEAYESGDINSNSKLDLSETWIYSASHTLTQADIDAGKVENLAIASATPPSGNGARFSVESSSASSGNATAGTGNGTATTTTLAADAGITVKKTVDDSALEDGVRVGDTLLYTIEVTNSGNVTLDHVTLVDEFADVTGRTLTLTTGPTPDTELSDDTLDVGEVWTFKASFALDAATIAAGGVENLATVTGTPPDGVAVSAESRVSGNSTADGAATSTPFPGEISGTVREYLAPQAGVTVYLLIETLPGVYDYVEDNGIPRSVVTGSDGNYAFVGLAPGKYGVEFASGPTAPLTAVSAAGHASGNRITDLSVAAGAVEVHQDAFFIDPAGIVYDSETFAPLQGVQVTLEHDGRPVPDSWLNTTLGNRNGSVTDASGLYTYVLDPAVAPSGVYTLRVDRQGYKPSEVYKPAKGNLIPALGGGIQQVVPDAVPSQSMSKLYYMSIDFTFVPSSAASSSNGIIHNHIPMDAELLPMVKADVEAILLDDLALTLRQQGKTMQGYAEGALKRLKSGDPSGCHARIDAIVEKSLLGFDVESLTPASLDILDRLAAVLADCPDSGLEIAVYADADLPAAEAQAITDRQAAAILAQLQVRNVAAGQIVARGYGAADASRGGRGGVVLSRQQADGDAGCVDTTDTTRDLTADAGENGRSLDGSFSRETRDCATNSWRITSGSVRHMTSDSGLGQTMANLSVRKERLVGDDRVAGRFLGAYATKSDLEAAATGTILGYGLNGGLYGARRISEAVYLDYYLGLAAGRHGFDFAFDRVGGVIDATGHYTYGAAFAGAALSGEAQAIGLTFAPRGGIDVAWSPGGRGDLTVTRGLLKDTGSVTVPQIVGLHLFADVRIEDLLPKSSALLAVTPGVFCDQGLDDAAIDCGLSARIELSDDDADKGRSYALALDLARSRDTMSTGVELRYGQALGTGHVDGGASLSTAGDVALKLEYALEY